MTFAQSYMFDALQPEPESLVPRVPFSARQKKEFGKTAQIIGLPPWLLHDATGYLLKLLQDNEDGHDSSWKPPKMSWGFYGAPHVEGPAVATSSIPSAALQFANRDPARARVKMMAKKRSRPQQILPEALLLRQALLYLAVVTKSQACRMPATTWQKPLIYLMRHLLLLRSLQLKGLSLNCRMNRPGPHRE